VEELFPPHTTAFMLGQPHYGAQGEVIKIDREHKGRIQLKFEVTDEPDLSKAITMQEKVAEKYEPGYRASQRLGMSSHILARVTGSIFIVRGAREQQMDSVSKTNIGLNLKFNKKSEEVCGFTKKSEDGQWLYSSGCVDVLREYQFKFPEVFDYIASANNASNDMFHELDVFSGPDGLERVQELVSWLDNLPTQKATRQPFGTRVLDEAVIKEMENSENELRKKEVVMQVRPHLLYLPNHLAGSSLIEPGTIFSLFDRVVNVRDGFSVPLGLKGTIIRIQKGSKVEDNLYDVLFDEAFTGGLSLRCSNGRGYRVPGSALINISFKEGISVKDFDINSSKNKPRAVVRPYEREENYSSKGSKNENVWNKKSTATAVAYGQPNQRKEESNKQIFPPAPQNLPKPPEFMQSKRSERTETQDKNQTRKGLGRGRGRDRGENQVQILKRSEGNAQEGWHKDLWESLESESQSSNNAQKENRQSIEKSPDTVADMENSLKKLLNISSENSKGKGAHTVPLDTNSHPVGAQNLPFNSDPYPSIGRNQDFCRTLGDHMVRQQRSIPRYDYITEQGTGLVAAQVVLDDGSMHHSPFPMKNIEDASESAARVALEVMGLLPIAKENYRGKGRGRRGKGRGPQPENKYQFWATYDESANVESYHPQEKKEKVHKNSRLAHQQMAGTEQMDIRYRDKERSVPQKNTSPVKPQFVPLQVDRKAVKSKEREVEEDLVMPKLETVEASVIKPSEQVTKVVKEENKPPKGRGKGVGGAKRKPRIAANFGGSPAQ